MKLARERSDYRRCCVGGRRLSGRKGVVDTALDVAIDEQKSGEGGGGDQSQWRAQWVAYDSDLVIPILLPTPTRRRSLRCLELASAHALTATTLNRGGLCRVQSYLMLHSLFTRLEREFIYVEVEMNILDAYRCSTATTPSSCFTSSHMEFPLPYNAVERAAQSSASKVCSL